MQHWSFSQHPVLPSERLVLRPLQDSDVDAIFQLRSDARVNRYLDRPPPAGVEEAQAFIQKIKQGVLENRSLYWVIGLRENPALIGTICLWNFSEEGQTAETGYELHPDFQKKGIMDEALKTVLRFAFETLQVETVVAVPHENNENSIRLLEKNGFVLRPEQTAEADGMLVYVNAKVNSGQKNNT